MPRLISFLNQRAAVLVPSCYEKSCLRPILFQDIQNRLRIFGRSVIERKIDNLLFILRFCCPDRNARLDFKRFLSCLFLLSLRFFLFFLLFFRRSQLLCFELLLFRLFLCFPAVHDHAEYRSSDHKKHQAAENHRIDIPPCFSPLVIVHLLSPHLYP